MVDDTQAILELLGTYRVATRNSIASVLPEKADPDKRIAKLVKDGLLRAQRGLPGNRTLYQMTKKGAAAAGVSPARGRAMGTQSILKNLGVLLFCQVPGSKRHRVEAEELGKALGIVLADGAFCLTQVKGRTMVLECYVPGLETPVPTIVRHLNKLLKEARKESALAEAIRDLRYGFAVIVPNAQRRKAVMDAVRTKGEGERLPLVKKVRVWVEALPDLGAYLGTAAPSLGAVSRGAGQASLWQSE